MNRGRGDHGILVAVETSSFNGQPKATVFRHFRSRLRLAVSPDYS